MRWVWADGLSDLRAREGAMSRSEPARVLKCGRDEEMDAQACPWLGGVGNFTVSSI